MIPGDYITKWRAHVPWVQDFQVEQDSVNARKAGIVLTWQSC